MTWLRTLSALFLLVPAGVAAQDAAGILARAAARYEGLSAFCADFRMTIDVTRMRNTVRSAGELCQSGDHLMEMRFTDPEGDRIVADGTYIWFYYPSSDPDQVTRTRVAASGSYFNLHEEFLSDPGERYASTLVGRETAGEKESFLLELTPRTPSPEYSRARIWIDAADSLVRKIEVHEVVSENIRTVEFSAVRLNPNIPASRFRFDPPARAQVITR